MKHILLASICFVFLFHQSFIFTMDPNEFMLLSQFHRKKTDENARDTFRELKANAASEFEKKKALEKKQKNDDDDDACKCIIS